MRQIITLVLILGFGSTVRGQQLYRYTFQEPHMGTYVKIIMYADNRQKAIATADAAYDTIRSLNQVLSDYLADSEVAVINNAPADSSLEISEEMYLALVKSQGLSESTNGAFDITVGPVVKLWRKARKENKLPDELALQAALNTVGYKKVKLVDTTLVKEKAHMQLDFGGIGKGMALAAAMKVINNAGIHRVLIDAGGDVLAGDAPPDTDGWEVVVGLFEQETKYQQKISAKNIAIASSGDFYQFLEIDDQRYSHIVDPATGLGVTRQKRSTVIGPDAATADALASAFCIMPIKEVKALLDKMQNYSAIIFSTGLSGNIQIDLGKDLLKDPAEL